MDSNGFGVAIHDYVWAIAFFCSDVGRPSLRKTLVLLPQVDALASVFLKILWRFLSHTLNIVALQGLSPFGIAMSKNKKIILGIVSLLELAVIVFCLIISIKVMTTISENANSNIINNGEFIGGLQNNPVLFFCSIVLPLFLIFVVDGVYLIVYAVKKESKLTEKERDAISEEAKRQAREEVLASIRNQNASDQEKKDD